MGRGLSRRGVRHARREPPVGTTELDGYGAAYTMAVVLGGSRLVLAGDFDTVDGQPRTRLAALDTATGA